MCHKYNYLVEVASLPGICVPVIFTERLHKYTIYFNLVYVDCLNPSNITNGSFSYLSTVLSSTAELSCIAPNLLRGNPTYTCEINGRWKGSGFCRKLKIYLHVPL